MEHTSNDQAIADSIADLSVRYAKLHNRVEALERVADDQPIRRAEVLLGQRLAEAEQTISARDAQLRLSIINYASVAAQLEATKRQRQEAQSNLESARRKYHSICDALKLTPTAPASTVVAEINRLRQGASDCRERMDQHQQSLAKALGWPLHSPFGELIQRVIDLRAAGARFVATELLVANDD